MTNRNNSLQNLRDIINGYNQNIQLYNLNLMDYNRNRRKSSGRCNKCYF